MELQRTKISGRVVVAIALLFFSSVTHAKRGPKPVAPPIKVNGIEFRAPNSPESEGVIEAWDPTSNKLLWSRRVYRNLKNPLVEEDVQWVFIKTMSLAANNQEIIVTDERGRTHLISIKPPVARFVMWQVAAISGIAVVFSALILLEKRRRRNLSMLSES